MRGLNVAFHEIGRPGRARRQLHVTALPFTAGVPTLRLLSLGDA